MKYIQNNQDRRNRAGEFGVVWRGVATDTSRAGGELGGRNLFFNQKLNRDIKMGVVLGGEFIKLKKFVKFVKL